MKQLSENQRIAICERSRLGTEATGTPSLSNPLCFRHASSHTEIEELLRMLCDIYEADGLGAISPRSGKHIIHDEYDEGASYFGLYEKGRPVACLRVVHGDRMPIGNRDPLPMLKYFPDADIVRAACSEWQKEGLTFTETGRMGILPEYRSKGLIEFIVDAIAAWGFLTAGVDVATTCAWPALQRIYRRVGFQLLENTRIHKLRNLGISCCCLETRLPWVPEGHKHVLEEMASAFTKSGAVWFNPQSSSSFDAPKLVRNTQQVAKVA